MPKTTFERIQDVLVDQLGIEPEKMKLESRFMEDMGADSLDSVEIVMAVEEEFETDIPALEISDEEAEKCKTVSDLVALIDGKLPKKAA